MKIVIEHDLPRKIRYGKMYLELGNASLYVAVEGSTASWSGCIGGKRKVAFLSDREYSRYRASNPAIELVDTDGERVILKSANGIEEEWYGPHWLLAGVRKPRPRNRTTN